MNKDLISTKTQIGVVFALYLMLAFLADVKGQKIDRAKIKSTTTNIDALVPTKGQTKAESCFVYHKGIDSQGRPSPSDTLGDLIMIYAASACQDTSEEAGTQKKDFIWQIQEIAQPQVDSLYKLKSKGRKIRIIMDDLTKAQQDEIKLRKKYHKSLGNYRMEIK